MEDYLQQSGRAGRDGKSSLAVLYFNKKDFAFSSGTSMNAYCVNEEKCRRQVLPQDFDCGDTPNSINSCML